jgi:hypothetical protein
LEEKLNQTKTAAGGPGITIDQVLEINFGGDTT